MLNSLTLKGKIKESWKKNCSLQYTRGKKEEFLAVGIFERRLFYLNFNSLFCFNCWIVFYPSWGILIPISPSFVFYICKVYNFKVWDYISMVELMKTLYDLYNKVLGNLMVFFSCIIA